MKANHRLLARRRQRLAERGLVLGVIVHVVLLLCVLAQLVYLASRFRLRVDMTSEQVWTSTDSTRRVLDKLEKRLVIEAYFSPKEALPVQIRETRAWADNFLDEVVQLGQGKVVLRRFDPNSDKAVRDKAVRVGIKPQSLRSQSATSVSVDEHWQGLRLVYGGGKQAVVPQFVPPSSFLAEALLTPKIKEVLTAEKRKFGYMEWPGTAVGQRNPAGIGWNIVRTYEGLKARYEFQNFKDEDGALLPADVDTLFLFRPKDLTDRQKYVIDQFIVGGGTLVLFADAAEYAIGPQRVFTKLPLSIDASGSQHQFVRQLEHYGIDWRPKVLGDMAGQAHVPRDHQHAAWEYFSVPVQSPFVMRYVPVAYPYFFHAVHADWAQTADQLAVDGNGNKDEQLAERFRETFVPGLPSDEFLFQVFQKINRGPGFYWPTWVGLRQRAGGKLDLPDGVEGRVLMWSSPLTLVEDPPQNLNPIGRDPRQLRSEIEQFNRQRSERLQAEPRQQAPLMVEISGKFASYFAGMERPKRPSEIKELEARRKADEAAGVAPGNDEQEQPDPGENPADPDAGPPPPKPGAEQQSEAPAVPAERDMITVGAEPGRIVVIGDATFLRDDVLRGDYQQAGGPVSATLALTFFLQLLDWLSEDQDLLTLQTRNAVDRTLTFADAEHKPNADPRTAEQNLRNKTSFLVWLNVLVPCLLLAAFGVVLYWARNAQKRAFLASLN